MTVLCHNENCCKYKNGRKNERPVGGFLCNKRNIILQESHLQCCTWLTHSNEPWRHSRLGRSLVWHCSPWHCSRYAFGNPVSARQHLVYAKCGWQLRCILREAEFGLYSEGWHFKRCRLPSALSTVAQVQALQSRWGCAQSRPPWLSWSYSCTTLQGSFSLWLYVPENTSWKLVSSQCRPAPKGICETCVIRHS